MKIEFINFSPKNYLMINPCSFCSAECCKNFLIVVTSYDVLRINRKTGLEPGDFSIISPLNIFNYNEELVLEFYNKDKLLISEGLLALRSRSCCFLNENKCTIHDFAPLSCKKYPYSKNSLFMPGKLCSPISLALFSPFKNIPKKYDKELEDYVHIVNAWNTKKGKKEDCLKFLLSKST